MGKPNAHYQKMLTQNKYYRLKRIDEEKDEEDVMYGDYNDAGYKVEKKVKSDKWIHKYIGFDLEELPMCCGVGVIGYFEATKGAQNQRGWSWLKGDELDELLAIQCSLGFEDYNCLIYSTRNDHEYKNVIESLQRLGFEVVSTQKKSKSMGNPIITLICTNEE